MPRRQPHSSQDVFAQHAIWCIIRPITQRTSTLRRVSRTRITDILDAHGISYRWLHHAEPVFTVEAAAQQRGVAPEEMVKSILLCDRSGHYVMACVPGAMRVEPSST
jgi:NADPH-dependent ferric siderophore reductase